MIGQALAKVEEVANHINDAVGMSENRKMVAEIQSKFDNVPLVSPTRFFVQQGTLVKKSPTGGEEPLKFFLFNDVLLWARHRLQGAKYVMENSVPIDDKFDAERYTVDHFKNAIRVLFIAVSVRSQSPAGSYSLLDRLSTTSDHLFW